MPEGFMTVARDVKSVEAASLYELIWYYTLLKGRCPWRKYAYFNKIRYTYQQWTNNRLEACNEGLLTVFLEKTPLALAYQLRLNWKVILGKRRLARKPFHWAPTIDWRRRYNLQNTRLLNLAQQRRCIKLFENSEFIQFTLSSFTDKWWTGVAESLSRA